MPVKRAATLIAILWVVSIFLGTVPLFATDLFSYGLSYFTFQYLPVGRDLQVRMLSFIYCTLMLYYSACIF